jgi:hypothetical protein
MEIIFSEHSEESEQEFNEMNELMNVTITLENIIDIMLDKRTKKNDMESLARILYNVYCSSTNWKSINNQDLPKEDEFFNDDDKKIQANAWRITAKYILDNKEHI